MRSRIGIKMEMILIGNQWTNIRRVLYRGSISLIPLRMRNRLRDQNKREEKTTQLKEIL